MQDLTSYLASFKQVEYMFCSIYLKNLLSKWNSNYFMLSNLRLDNTQICLQVPSLTAVKTTLLLFLCHLHS